MKMKRKRKNKAVKQNVASSSLAAILFVRVWGYKLWTLKRGDPWSQTIYVSNSLVNASIFLLLMNMSDNQPWSYYIYYLTILHRATISKTQRLKSPKSYFSLPLSILKPSLQMSLVSVARREVCGEWRWI